MGSLVAVFEALDPAREAVHALREAGVPGDRVSLSAALTEDDIAAEAPGQSFGNQPGQPPTDRPPGSYADASRSGSFIVTVWIPPDRDTGWIENLLRQSGARYTGAADGGDA